MDKYEEFLVPPTDFLTIEGGRGKHIEYSFAGGEKNCSVQKGVHMGVQINPFDPYLLGNNPRANLRAFSAFFSALTAFLYSTSLGVMASFLATFSAIFNSLASADF